VNNAAIDLRAVNARETPAVLATYRGLTATIFRYASGVIGLRIANRDGHIDTLPFQGQQIWDAVFFGRTLTMRSIFSEPRPTREFLDNYGGFFIHCGATAMGNPGPSDRHPEHGELPNAPYTEAQLIFGDDEAGPYMGLTGTYRHTVAFMHNYVATPSVRIAERGGRIRAVLNVANLRPKPMDLMYLAHINFRPVDGAALLDTAPDDPGSIRVRDVATEGELAASPALQKLVREWRKNPAAHREMTIAAAAGGALDPEIVLSLDCRADNDGHAHAMQRHPDGQADFVSYRPGELGHALRWIARNGSEDSLGLLLPATAEADGYAAEKAKGNVLSIPPQGSFSCALAFGALEANEADALAATIGSIRKD
jgi:hypothetical protein